MKFHETKPEGAEQAEALHPPEVNEIEKAQQDTSEALESSDNRAAFQAISKYYGRHNYGPEHFKQYSQDPEWRQLFREAYPDKELPPIKEKTELREDAFRALPAHREMPVRRVFADAHCPDGVKRAINETSPKLSLEDTRLVQDKHGNYVYEPCHFDSYDGKIRMKPIYGDEQYVRVFSHELGHFIDYFKGDLSGKEEFELAISADMRKFRMYGGEYEKEKMLMDLAKNDALFSPLTSDILSGCFHNDERIYSFYKKETYGGEPYGHENEYWDEVKGPRNALQKEVFANLFSAYAGVASAEEIEFLEKYFPETTSQFKIFLDIEE